MDTRKCLRGLICFMLASLLCAGFVAAEDKDKPGPPIKRGAEQVSSIFDDSAEEFEESTYTPPADIEEKIKSIPPIPSNIIQYLKDKYKMKGNDFVSARLHQTKNGALGHINIDGYGGNINPPAEIEITNKEDRIRAKAKAFLKEENSLFGLIDMEELKEVRFEVNELGITLLHYHRYIGNLPLNGVEIAIHFGPNENITWVSADAMPITQEVYQAAAKKTIGKGKLFRIIRQDIKTASGKADAEVGISSAQKVAISKAPYMVWKVRAGMQFIGWDYTIDAFTGDILEKQDARRF